MEYERTLCVGDIHGNYPALMQALERAGCDYERDRIISLGDIYDGLPKAAECVEELMKFNNFVWVLGNHDEYVRRWFRGQWKAKKNAGKEESRWLRRGGLDTVKSYCEDGKLRKKLFMKHARLMEKAVLYFIDEHDHLYVHAGLDWRYPVDGQPDESNYYTGRDTWRVHAVRHEERGTKFPFSYVFIGHSHTEEEYPDCKPVRRANLWNLDQGAGWDGKLTIMDVDTFEYWQSDRQTTSA